jgi:predicted dehydrogenase
VIGTPLQVVERRYGYFRKQAWPDWWITMDGFLLMHLGSHSVDAILWVLEKKPKWVFAQGKARKVDGTHGAIDAFAFAMELEDDILVGIHHESIGGEEYLAFNLLIVGEEGRLEMDSFFNLRLNGKSVYQQSEKTLDIALKAEVEEFVNAIRENRPPSVPGNDVLPTVAALDAGRLSLHSKRVEPVSC